MIYKTQFTIWTDYPTDKVELDYLAREAMDGDAIATGGVCEVAADEEIPEGVLSFLEPERLEGGEV